MRINRDFHFQLTPQNKKKLLRWASQFSKVVWLDSNHFPSGKSSYDAILAVDASNYLKSDTQDAFKSLDSFYRDQNDWIFGYLGYDLKNDIENLRSDNFDGLQFPDLCFFVPKRLLVFSSNSLTFSYMEEIAGEIEADFNAINAGTSSFNDRQSIESTVPKISLRTSKDSYFRKFMKIEDHIQNGDIYEVNFCQEFFAENAIIDPVKCYLQLNAITESPFSTFVKIDHLYALSGSPERFLRKVGPDVISQPIKGTARRDMNPDKDRSLAEALKNDPKERSENIMITDLVRNDLSRVALRGSVKVESLCEVQTFKQVHQLVSTISCKVKPDESPVSILKNTFPMGSMTGAPKISAMKIIEQVEDFKRGLYSGSVGFITPAGNFDFNVIIRSILYNHDRKYISFSVGGAITAGSTAENEYEECLLKAKAMRKVLETVNENTV